MDWMGQDRHFSNSLRHRVACELPVCGILRGFGHPTDTAGVAHIGDPVDFRITSPFHIQKRPRDAHRKAGIDLNPPKVCGCDLALFRSRSPSFVDTGYVRTYYVYMNVTLSIDEQIVARARKKAKVLGKSLNELIRDYLQKLGGGDDPERSIEEFKHLSGRGHSRGWRFNREEIHERS